MRTLGTPPSTWARITARIACSATKDRGLPDRKFRPSTFSGSLGMRNSPLGANWTTVSSMRRSPSWIYWPMECRSAVYSTLAGNRPLPSLPSLSP